MENTQKLNHQLETAAWGAIFIWWGILELFGSLPEGIGAIGFGLILVGLNAARSRNGIPTRSFTTTLSILALVLGGLQMVNSYFQLPFDLPVFAILLITLGAILLGEVVLRMRGQEAVG